MSWRSGGEVATRRWGWHGGAAAILFVACACEGDPPGTVDASTPSLDAAAPTGADILFVVDNSGAMGDEQDALFDSIGGFIAELEAQAAGELPSLHVGVVSTNLGIGGFPISGCVGDGDGAILQSAPRVDGCSPPSNRFIIDVPDGLGGRTRNYAAGTLVEAISCIGRLGESGCGFEQPLQAMHRALDGTVAENAGFLRDGALLVVVILTNEDDCSASDTELFDPAFEELGPLPWGYRCFEYGVVCSPDDPATPGTKTGCRSREDSAYTFPVRGYIEFLEELKPPGRTIVLSIHGDPSPVVIQADDTGNLRLDWSCTPTTGWAKPAIRVEQLVDGFAADGIVGSLCTGFSDALVATAARVASKL